MSDEMIVRLLDESTIEEQVKVYIRSFDVNEPIDEIIEYWKKKHYDNPTQRSYIFGVYAGEQLVSINAYMPMHYQINAEICKVIQSCESGTIPEYRGKGIWSKVVRFAVNFLKKENIFDFLIGFPNYENSYGGFMKMGWIHVADVANYILITNGKELTKNFAPKVIASFGAFLGLQKVATRSKTKKEYRVVNELLEVNDCKKGFVLEANLSYVLWKENYKGLQLFSIVDDKNKTLAECMYFRSTYKDSEVVNFCNPMIDKGCHDIEGVYATAIKHVIESNPKAAFIRTWVIQGSIAEKMYKKIWFLHSMHHNPFIIYPLKDNVVLNDVLLSADNWINISFLDLD